MDFYFLINCSTSLYNRPCQISLRNMTKQKLDLMKECQKVRLFILDELLLVPLSRDQQRSLLELLERRSDQSSTIFCSQYSFQGWHEQIGGGAIADAILDRIIPGAYKMEIQGDVSMRQRLADTEE